jgi:hypothetical protein
MSLKIKRSQTFKEKHKNRTLGSDDESGFAKIIKIGTAEKKHSVFTNTKVKNVCHFEKLNLFDNSSHSDFSTDIITNNKNLRRDFRGNCIMKGKGKKHHITFRDYTGRIGLVDFVEIEMFKNVEFEEDSKLCKKSEKDNENTSCTCVIF